jgi:hypothetical protein
VLCCTVQCCAVPCCAVPYFTTPYCPQGTVLTVLFFLYCTVLPAGLTLHLDNLKIYNPSALATGPGFSGNVLVALGASVGRGCLIGPDVSIGDGCVIGDGVRLSNCVVMRGVRIKDHSKVGGWLGGCCWAGKVCREAETLLEQVGMPQRPLFVLTKAAHRVGASHRRIMEGSQPMLACGRLLGQICVWYWRPAHRCFLPSCCARMCCPFDV